MWREYLRCRLMIHKPFPLKLGTVVVATIIVAMITACSPQKNDKATLVVGISLQDANNLDPHQSSSVVDMALFNYLFNGLVRIKPGQASLEFIEPDLAESWESNAAETEWTFHLRRGVQCHHGYGELTADDIVYSIRRAADPTRSGFAGSFDALKSISAVDKYTVNITLEHTVPGFLGLLSNYHGGNIVCQRAAVEMGMNFNKKPVGTGPFMFVEYQPQQYVRLAANDQYFRGKPRIREIMYRYILSEASLDLAFATGEIDMISGQQNQRWMQRTKKVPGAVVVAMEPAELSTLYLNVTAKPLDDIRVRQAIAYAIDRPGLVQLKGKEANREGKSVVPIGYVGFSADVSLLPHNLAKAKQLLAEAGYPDGITLKTVHTTWPKMASTMEVVQAQLYEAGIHLEIEPVEHATFHSKIRQDLSPLVHYAAARFPIADVYLTGFFHSKSTVGTPTAITNFSHCAVADNEIDMARIEPAVDKRNTLWKIAQEKIAAEVCGIPLIEVLQVWAYRDNLDLGYELKGNLNLAPPIIEATHFKDL